MNCFERIEQFPGDVGFYYDPLDGAAHREFGADKPLVAASVIKIPIMAAAFDAIRRGALDEHRLVEIRPEMKKPSCGALTYMHDGLQVTVLDLITLMIILSDNTATNLMIDILGVEPVNALMAAHDIPGICLRRKLFEPELSARGIQNTITARGVAALLKKIYENQLLGAPWDGRMLDILRNQRLNGKLPFYLHEQGIKLAHKTGEDDGITHDVGIVYAEKPFLICMLSNNVNVPAFERLMQETAAELAGVAIP